MISDLLIFARIRLYLWRADAEDGSIDWRGCKRTTLITAASGHPDQLRRTRFTSDSVDEIMSGACRLVGKALTTELARVMELQLVGTTLLAGTGWGWKSGVVGLTTIAVSDDPSVGLAIKTGLPVVSADIETEARFGCSRFLTEHGVRAVANVPIGDAGQLREALFNLAINGAQAMPGGGTLSLDARAEGDGAQCVVITATDNGVGMDEGTRSRAFEPFFTTRCHDGSGLGLSMVQGFAEQSGGEASIESAPGRGTTVVLRLPVAMTGNGSDAGWSAAAPQQLRADTSLVRSIWPRTGRVRAPDHAD